MSLVQGQPRVMFAKRFNPGDIAGQSFVPKVITVEKTITAASADDFWAAPAGTFISRAFAYVATALVGTNPTVTLGTDGNVDALINTDFDVSTVGNWASNTSSTTAEAAAGLYLPNGDNIRVTVTGTDVSEGVVRFAIEYFELADMFNRGIHFEL